MFKRGFKSWCENVAIQQRRELKLQSVDPLDPWALAKHLEVDVWAPEQIPGIDPGCLKILLIDDPDSWSAVTIRMGSKVLIILNSVHRGGRPASNLMHELSHILLNHKPARIDITEDGLLMLNTYEKDQEEEATWLAGCLLLPRDALMSIRQHGLNQKVAAKRYGVSVDMLQWRIKMTGVDYQIIHMKKRGVRSVWEKSTAKGF